MNREQAILMFDKLSSSNQLFKLQEYVNCKKYSQLTDITSSWVNGVHKEYDGIGMLRDPNGGDENGGIKCILNFYN